MDAYLWLRVKRPRERLRPAFLIIGAMKAGTTSLFLYLAGHPKIAQPLVKEINYFDRNWERRPLNWYFAHFPQINDVSAGMITGESSPGYLFNSGRCASRVASVLPQAKIIVLLRNPVHRAISHYYHDLRKKIEPTDELAASLVAEGMEIQPELTNRLVTDLGWSKPSPINPLAEKGQLSSCIRGGLYVDLLAHWFKYFDRDRVLILKSEDLFANPRDVYARTLEFLDLDFFDVGPMKAHNVGNYGSNVEPSIIRYLSGIYADPNRRLAELLGRDFAWDQPG
jgi:hypothetical protein